MLLSRDLHILEDLEEPERCPHHAVRLDMKFPTVYPMVEEQRVALGCAPYGENPGVGWVFQISI